MPAGSEDQRHCCGGTVDCGRAGNAENHSLVFFLEALQKEDTGLFAFNQEDGSVFVIDFGLGGDGGTNDDFIEIGLSQSVFGDIELDVDLRSSGARKISGAFGISREASFR